MKCAFLTSRDLPNLIAEELAVVELLRKKNITIDVVVWNDKVDWSIYNCVVIRTTWDYYLHSEKFLDVLQEIQRCGCRLFNSFEIAKWNTNKRYLLELEQKQVAVIPTKIVQNVREENWQEHFTRWDTQKLVVKPVISAGAYHTYVIDHKEAPQIPSIDVSYMVQPFLPSVAEEGEWSFMFFGGQYSHAVIKRPKQNDFRVQEEHGGSTELMEVEHDDLLEAKKVIAAIPKQLYARVDMIRYRGKLHLIELELIEPQLFLANCTKGVEMFAETFCQMCDDK
ncbi:ATP-grasp domain-containing protein [Candidatus Uabimicrobium amorphum]|uniref:Transporter n=1 Tax=Uabimicrobium amorphum TaxID=2596890 RepID=A0A5S9F667_UABAM|nr:hypothetical protein [Candidatus Uabimicrobium amorphum]BBM87362.1 transporter [Candidatus Uabimicrobium amorphum]